MYIYSSSDIRSSVVSRWITTISRTVVPSQI